jgi:MFS family permease
MQPVDEETMMRPSPTDYLLMSCPNPPRSNGKLGGESSNVHHPASEPFRKGNVPFNSQSARYRSTEENFPPMLRMQDPSPEVPSDASESVSFSDNGYCENSENVLSADQPSSTLTEAAPEEDEQGFAPVLRNRNFLTLWSGQVFSQLSDKVYLVLMIALIASRFQSEGQSISGWVSSIMIAFTIPAILFGSIAGVYVDRWSKKGVLVATNLLRGALVFALPLVLWLSHGWTTVQGLPVGFCLLLAITFLVSTLTQFFAPAEQSIMPLVVDRKHLLSANSLYTTTMMASVIIGFAVGEPLLALADTVASWFGITSADFGKEMLVGGGYAIAGVLLLLMQTGEKTNDIPPEEQPHVWQDIKDGLRYLKEQAHVRGALIQLVILFSIFAALAVLSVRLAEVMPEIKSSQFGFLLAAGGVGMAAGAAILGNFGQRFAHARLGTIGSIGMAASLIGIAFSYHVLWLTLVLIALVGAFAALVGIPMQTTIQQETPEDMRGKVFGLQNNAVNIALSLPLVLAGVSETLFGLRVVFLALAALTIAGGTLTWYIAHTREGVRDEG